MLTLSIQLMAQYGGGNGRGETNIAINTLQLNGTLLNLYGGGNGRGEIFTAVNTNQLNGIGVKIYGGGNGRGEVLFATATNQLNGQKLLIYGGGNGRGETLTAINTNQLDGNMISIYGGGNGRGEIANSINTNTLNGAMLLMYQGGNGRGESNAAVSTLELDGLAASIYLGGNGRGESLFQLNNQGLPAQINCFGATDDGHQSRVYWQTACEKNCDYFTVEKSADSINFQNLGIVNSACNSNTLLSYQLYDASPFEGANYYRLKTTGKDGKSFYSALALVYFQTAASDKITVFPNPAKYQFTLTISNGIQSKVMASLDIKLVSSAGQTVLQKQGLNGYTQTVDVSKLTPGTYYLLVTINGKVSTAKVIKN